LPFITSTTLAKLFYLARFIKIRRIFITSLLVFYFPCEVEKRNDIYYKIRLCRILSEVSQFYPFRKPRLLSSVTDAPNRRFKLAIFDCNRNVIYYKNRLCLRSGFADSANLFLINFFLSRICELASQAKNYKYSKK